MWWLNLIFIGLFTFCGFILMLFPGWLAKLSACPCFIFCLPLWAVSKQTFIAEGGALFTESFGPLFVGSAFTLWSIFAFLAYANVADELDRDILLRSNGRVGRTLPPRTVA